jgi:hypothetical protein
MNQTLDQLHEQLAQLQRVRASGERRVRFDREEVEYRTDAELAAAIADLERRIAAAGRSGVSTVRFSYSKGL